MPKNKNAVKEPRAQKKDGFFKTTCKTLADASLGTEYKTVAAEGKQVALPDKLQFVSLDKFNLLWYNIFDTKHIVR